jgi:uncharacterized protein (TIGR03083 family)
MRDSGPVDDAPARLRTAYGDLSTLLAELSDAEAAQPSGCAGWAVLDLAQHLVFDARRGLVATATPAEGPADCDAVQYWRDWSQSPAQADDDLWRTRVSASVAGGIGALAAAYAETSAAALVSAARLAPTDLVTTQGRVLARDDLLSTLTVEAAVHHVDLVRSLERAGPGAGPLAEVRRVLVGVLGSDLPDDWDDLTAARRGTGREALTPADRRVLGSRAERFPLFS